MHFYKKVSKPDWKFVMSYNPINSGTYNLQLPTFVFRKVSANLLLPDQGCRNTLKLQGFK